MDRCFLLISKIYVFSYKFRGITTKPKCYDRLADTLYDVFPITSGAKKKKAYLQKGRYIMKTVQTVLHQLTDPKTIMAELRDTLKTMDPGFINTEEKFLAAASRLEKELGGSMTPSVSAFLAAKEQAFAAEIIYIGWQGFQLNLDIFHAPVNALLLRGDYEELHRERCLGTLPMARKAWETIHAFYEVIREKYRDKMELTDDITSFYSYLQTTGYKLAHYFGFRLADQFLPYVIPGYTDASVDTMYYQSDLKRHLSMDVERLDK